MNLIGTPVYIYPKPKFEIKEDLLGIQFEMCISLGERLKGHIVAYHEDNKEYEIEYVIGYSIKSFFVQNPLTDKQVEIIK